MVVPFGVGVGDFLAVSRLIGRIVAELRKNGQSSLEYQSLLIELESLDRALRQVQSLLPAEGDQTNRLDAIRALATTCEFPLREFLSKIEKFDSRLSSWNAASNRFSGFHRRMQWSLMYSQDVKDLRNKVAAHVQTISLLLMTQATDVLEKADKDRHEIARGLHQRLSIQESMLGLTQKTTDEHVKSLARLKVGQSKILAAVATQEQTLSTLEDQGIQIASTNQSVLSVALEILHKVSLGISKSKELAEQMARMFAVLSDFTEMRQRMAELLQKFGEIQKQLQRLSQYFPQIMFYRIVHFRDAFNELRPLPFDICREWKTFRGMVAVIFTDRPGLRRVEMGQFVINHARIGRQVGPEFWRNAIQPGDELSMAMVLPDHRAKEGFCPWKECGASTEGIELTCGGKICKICHRWGKGANTSIEDDGDILAAAPMAPEQPAPKWKARLDCVSDARTNTSSTEPGCRPVLLSNSSPLEVEEDIALYHFIQFALLDDPKEPAETGWTDGLESSEGFPIEAKVDEPSQMRSESFHSAVQNADKAESWANDWSHPGKSSRKARSHLNHQSSDGSSPFYTAYDPTIDEPYPYAQYEHTPYNFYYGDTPSSKDRRPSSKHTRKARYVPQREGAWHVKDSHLEYDRYADYSSPRRKHDYVSPNSGMKGTTRRAGLPNGGNNYYYSRETRTQDEHIYVVVADHANYAQTYNSDPRSEDAKKPSNNQWFYYNSTVDPYYDDESKPKRPRARRSASSTQHRVDSSKPKKSPPQSHPKATGADAIAHGIPVGYSMKNWDPAESPILLLGSVFDANSLGKWIYDWTVFHHGTSTPMADVAGDLWLLLIKLAGKMKRAEEVMCRIGNADDREMVSDFLDSGDRLWAMLKKLLKICERYMWKATKDSTSEKTEQGTASTNGNADAVTTKDKMEEDKETGQVEPGEVEEVGKQKQALEQESKASTTGTGAPTGKEETKSAIDAGAKTNVKKGSSGRSMGKNAGIVFVETIFGRDRELETTEKLMNSIRLWNMRFDANCEYILRRPSGLTASSGDSENKKKNPKTAPSGQDSDRKDEPTDGENRLTPECSTAKVVVDGSSWNSTLEAPVS